MLAPMPAGAACWHAQRHTRLNRQLMLQGSTQPKEADAAAAYEASTPAAPGGPPAIAPAVAPDTSPTWELELLISGAVLFALFKLPGAMDGLFDRVVPHLTRGARVAAFLAAWYGTAAVYTLILCFVTHLVARAYWVGLVGLHSVFPAGPRWDRLRFGPISRDVYRERLPSVQALISRVDNVCSVIFSFAFLIVLIVVFSVMLIGVIAGTAYLISESLLGGRSFLAIYNAILAAVFGLPLLLRLADRRYGARATPGTRLHSVLRRSAAVFYRVQVFGVYGTIFTTLFSNIRGRLIYPIFVASFAIVLALSLAHSFTREGSLGFNAYPFFDDGGGRAVRAANYETSWPADVAASTVPSVQSDVITEPYVKLFIPFSPRSHNPTIAARCPTLRPLRREGMYLGDEDVASDSAAGATIACLVSLHQPTLDGRPIAASDFEFHTHPRTRARGILAYIPAEPLTRGRHVITVERVVRPGARVTSRRFVIPFWR